MIKVFASSNKHKIAEVKEILKDDEIVTDWEFVIILSLVLV